MFEFFALVIAIVAFIFARKAFNRIDALRALDEMGPGNMMIEGRPFRVDLD